MANSKTLFRQHERLRLVRDRLRVLATASGDVLPDDRLQELLSHDIEQLHRRIEDRFEVEEGDGYFKDIYKRRPSMSDKLEILKSQHQSIRSQARGLLQLCSAKRVEVADLRADLLKFLEKISKHEAEERDLVQRYMLRDTGGG